MHFLSLGDFSHKELRDLLDHASELKARPTAGGDALRGKTLALVFLKHSTRTRVSFEAGMHQLGGNAIYLSEDTSQLGRGETIADTVKTLSRYVDGIAARVFGHEQIEEIAQHAGVPVINGLTDFNHPCQILADLMTIEEHLGSLRGCRLAFYGAADNNIVNSFLHACPLFGVQLTVCSPPGQALNPVALAAARKAGENNAWEPRLTHDPAEAAADADVLYTDVWFSMHETPSEEGLAAYRPYQVNEALMARAPASALFMHCMPVHRGEEATDGVADSAQSVIFDEAENRLHAQKAVLLSLMG
ncbi:ornithine carbamoyltransferase [Candidatus Poribacteria bacterium]|jgi:ornithine carbamoyltransferase|nr:ornithine carbamoyltransferase [Candidatus Poribacteria bacterium]MBT5537107.1 ornithine carbamoyltransferase [Candidatus Poribacteria bacterium]MBT5711439.1 ornithine carbamoyltransferase [Candidatus Poribacteria bacterium]MBT7100581.1 ornithine carbamoyltransferase [Candidatus Poribacteria bacterium]MBT7806902.1 ornithine carbamoyltransferase [Candidatus Poribacteria bacterium]